MLASLLTALCEQTKAASDTEIVVVDNGSTDETKQIVERFVTSGPEPTQVRYILEARVGLSAARNAGARLARGRYVIFLDDDVDPAPGWLIGYRRLIETAPQVRVAGGPIEPRPEPTADISFISRKYLWVYGHLNYGGSTGPLNLRQTLNGGNMFFERSDFLAFGGLDESFGHKGDTVGGAEEQELLARVRNRVPDSCYYTGGAKVYHRIPASRATMEWAVARVRGGSRAVARSEARNRPAFVVGLKSLYYSLILIASRVFPVNELTCAHCSAYREGLRDP